METASNGRSQIKRRAIKVISLVVAGLLFLSGVYVTFVAFRLQGNISTIDSPFPDERTRPAPSTDKALRFLILGTDARAGTSGQRADTIMVSTLSADRQKLTTISIPRDSWVEIPGYGMNKINTSVAIGGISLGVQTVEQLLNVRIDHVMSVDMAGFRDLTDTIGGIDVDIDEAFTASNDASRRTFTVGINRLDGIGALALVRERYAFASGDFKRIDNQQRVVQAILKKLSAMDVTTKITTIEPLAVALSKHLSADSGVNLISLSQWAASRPDHTLFTIPTLGSGTGPGGESIVVLDPDALPLVRDSLQRSEFSELERLTQ